MELRHPRPLRPGDTIAVTSPSAGVAEPLRGRLDFAVRTLQERGFATEVGDCMDGTTHISAPAEQRAAELMRMLTDPTVAAVIPPWGGDTAIDLIPLLDFDLLAASEPTWLVGYSDISTLLTPITLLSGWATLHGNNLMDTPYAVPAPLLSWLDVASAPAGSTLRQASAGVHRASAWDDWEVDPTPTAYRWNGTGGWARIDDGTGDLDLTGRLIGGCIETLANLAGSPYADTSRLRETTGDPLLVYVEAAEDEALDICRNLHGMRLAGFFDGAVAVLIGRASAPDSATLTQRDAVLDALGGLGVPMIADVECGHVPPHLPIVNGSVGRLVFNDQTRYLEQTLA